MCPPAAFSTGQQADRAGIQPANHTPDCVPHDVISQQAYAYASGHLHPLILNHSLRVWLYASALEERDSGSAGGWLSNSKRPLLFTACVLHDVGTSSAHDGSQRFEVEGADAAVSLLQQQGVSEADAHEVWVAIALHDTPGIAERISPLARLVRLAVLVDFKRPSALALTTEERLQANEKLFERGEVEKVLGDTVVQQALGKSTEEERGEKAPPACWPGILLRSKLENPEWEGVNKAF